MTNHNYEIRACEPEATAGLLWIGGTPGVGLADRDLFELVEDGITKWKCAIQWEQSRSPFKSQLVWKEANAILFGGQYETYALDIQTGAVKLHQRLQSYFGSFAIAPLHNLLLILTGDEIIAWNERLETAWSTHGLAIDGVVLNEIGETLVVDAEMDPPGSWQRVTIDLKTGAELNRESKQ